MQREVPRTKNKGHLLMKIWRYLLFQKQIQPPLDLTDRISNLETTVADMKDQLKQLVDAFKSRPSHQQLCQEL
ncbi:hypothetical protein HanPSC8_Chr15g0659741 [Helianthus annuus]|nr:hypothetical protein HanPSC8_Chr15g0659741 [Helianthus annuus]